MDDVLRLDVEPIGKPRMTQRDKWMKRPPVVRYHLYCQHLGLLCNECNYKVEETLSLTFVLTMPKSWSNKKKLSMDGKPHQSKPDLDNLIKAFKDALCEDDSFVHTYEKITKVWGEQGCILVHR
jgi:Holliday junction resolvase RusA-like endonuclease